jgi:hypothetical protein
MGLFVEVDDAQRQKNGKRTAIHQPYSADLSTSDFYLFGHMKGLLKGKSFETGKDLLLAVEVIAGTFEESVTRFERWIETNGDYAG